MRRPVPAGPGLPRAGDDRARIRAAARVRRRVEAGERERVRVRPRHRAVVLGAALLAAVLVGVPAVLAFGPVFPLRTVQVVGADGTSAAAIRARLAPLTGRPLALVDDAAVRTALAGLPAVASWSAARLPPHTLQLSVVLRVPAAQVRAGDAWRTEDAAGVVLATGPRAATLPEVRAAGGAFTATTAALAALPSALRSRVAWAGAASPDTVQLHLSGGLTVVWGDADHGAAKAAALAAALQHAARHAHVVDVSSPGLVRVG